MKRHLFPIITVIWIVTLLAVSAMATGTQANFIDADADGICDNRNNSAAFVDDNSNGICDNREELPAKTPQGNPNQEPGNAYADADEDGICDNREVNNTPDCPQNGENCGKAENQNGGHGKQYRKGKHAHQSP